MNVAKATSGKTTEEARTAVVYVRLTRTERETLRALAMKEQRTLGEWSRLKLLEQLGSDPVWLDRRLGSADATSARPRARKRK